jgi:hypothetical protein
VLGWFVRLLVRHSRKADQRWEAVWQQVAAQHDGRYVPRAGSWWKRTARCVEAVIGGHAVCLDHYGLSALRGRAAFVGADPRPGVDQAAVACDGLAARGAGGSAGEGAAWGCGVMGSVTRAWPLEWRPIFGRRRVRGARVTGVDDGVRGGRWRLPPDCREPSVMGRLLVGFDRDCQVWPGGR